MSDQRWDDELVQVATRVVDAASDGGTHTVAAAARDASGRIHTAMNLFHFTGGPCAEPAVIAAAAAQTRSPLVAIVAVGDSGRGVLPPCGRCRQVLLDTCPDIDVMLPGGRTARPAELLPDAYLGYFG